MCIGELDSMNYHRSENLCTSTLFSTHQFSFISQKVTANVLLLQYKIRLNLVHNYFIPILNLIAYINSDV